MPDTGDKANPAANPDSNPLSSAEGRARAVIDDLRAGRVRMPTARDIKDAAGKAVQDGSVGKAVGGLGTTGGRPGFGW